MDLIRYGITIQFKDVPTLIRRGFSVKIWFFKSYEIIKTSEKRYRIARAKAREIARPHTSSGSIDSSSSQVEV